MSNASLLTISLPDGSIQKVAWVKSATTRSLRLSLTRDGLRLSTPSYVRQNVVESFLQSNIAWIEQQIERHDRLPTNQILYLGRPHHIEIQHMLSAQTRIVIEDNKIIVSPVEWSTDSVQNTLERWLKTQASELATPRLITFGQKMGVSIPALKFKDTLSRWGSCSHTGSISLNWRLAHAPIPVLEYVVIHELAHRIHLNHSSRFWDVVSAHDPDHAMHRGWLKRHGHLCRTPLIQLPTDRTPLHL